MNIKESFEKYLRILFQDLTRIDSLFELSIHIVNYRSNRLKELNIAPSFFSLVLDSFFHTTVISLARLYDSYKIINRSDKNLIRFMNFTEQNIKLFPKDDHTIKKFNIIHPVSLTSINKYRKSVQEVTPILDKLFDWRDKYFAHYDNKFFLNENLLETKYGLVIGDIRKLIRLAAEILNHFSIGYNGVANAVRTANLYDIDSVIEILHKHLSTKRT